MQRRDFLKASSALTLGLAAPLSFTAAASGRDPRLVVIVLRGGMDGLAAVPALGDPNYKTARNGLALSADGGPKAAFNLDGFFGLHPEFVNLASMYKQGEALAVHAIAPPYHKRSHFSAQDVLETGLTEPQASASGWLYRALETVGQGQSPVDYAYSIGTNVPRILRGDEPVGAWSPDKIPDPRADTLAQVEALYEHDSVLGPKLEAGIEADRMIKENINGRRFGTKLPQLAKAAGKFLSLEQGPRIAVLNAGGWDTHRAQGKETGRLAVKFSQLDDALGTLKATLGNAWQDTAVVVVTEFGRTVARNGSSGTDHGVGGVALMAGGAVNGGQVVADWPGLAPEQLFKGRDLDPTTDMRALFAGVLIDHLGADSDKVFTDVFPGLESRLHGLIA